MRMSDTRDGLTVRAIVGTHNVLFGMDLADARRAGCLGFTLRRTDLTRGGQPLAPAQQQTKIVPNRITFPGADPNLALATDNSPVQKFRWGDYTVEPGERYRWQITARYGTPGALTDGPSVTLEFATEDPQKAATAVFFNRGAAASQAFVDEFGADDPDKMPAEKRGEALAWLSRGLQEALIAFLRRAQDGSFALHAAVYEFQKPELLAELKDAQARGSEVAVVYHFRHKDDKDNTWKKNAAAAKAAGIEALCTQRTQDAGVIMHNKFVVLLRKDGAGKLAPEAVWTGSTNWTDGGIYGQLNVGHAIDDPALAMTYEAYFQLLKKDEPDAAMKAAVAQTTPVPAGIPAKGVVAIFSPQTAVAALDLYGAICAHARCLMACAPFELAAPITKTFDPVPLGTMHYLLLDKEGSLGKPPQIAVIERDVANSVAFAATLTSNLTSFQNKLNARSGESFHHPGIHIHSKILLADPFGDDPILVTGSANYSINSTQHNDENSLVIRGDTVIADIYATEFMRMFEHYHFRAAKQKAKAKASVVQLDPTDGWSAKYYVPNSPAAFDRMTFAGTLPIDVAAPQETTAPPEEGVTLPAAKATAEEMTARPVEAVPPAAQKTTAELGTARAEEGVTIPAEEATAKEGTPGPVESVPPAAEKTTAEGGTARAEEGVTSPAEKATAKEGTVRPEEGETHTAEKATAEEETAGLVESVPPAAEKTTAKEGTVRPEEGATPDAEKAAAKEGTSRSGEGRPPAAEKKAGQEGMAEPRAAKQTPTAKPAAKKKPTPKPTAEKRPAPKPAVEQKPTRKPAAKKKPTPKPAVEKKPTPKPAAKKTPTPKPTATKKPTPKPAGKRKPTPKPTAKKKPVPKPAVPKSATKKPRPEGTRAKAPKKR